MQFLIAKKDLNIHNLKGDVIELRASGYGLVGKEPDSFVLAEIQGLAIREFEDCKRDWRRDLQFSTINHNTVEDIYTLKLYATNSNLGKGEVSKSEFEPHITKWNGTIVSDKQNEVIFNLDIFRAAVSGAFWDFDPRNIKFAQTNYDGIAGFHIIEADYSMFNVNPTYLERYVDRHGYSIINHQDKKLVYRVESSLTKDIVEKNIYQKTLTTVAKRRFSFPESFVDEIVTEGGKKTFSKSSIEASLTDKSGQLTYGR